MKLLLIPIAFIASLAGSLWLSFVLVNPWLISLSAPAWIAGILAALLGLFVGSLLGSVLVWIIGFMVILQEC